MDTKLTTKERIEERRSLVRVWVTYLAAIYAFAGSGILIVAALSFKNLDAAMLNAAKDLFMTVLPVATGIITYWFASRKPAEDAPTTESEDAPAASGSADQGGQQQREPDGGEQGQRNQGGVQDAAVDQIAHGAEPPEGGDAGRRNTNA